MGPTIRFHLRMNNNSGANIEALTNNFILYSPDGALWLPPDGQSGNGQCMWNPAITWSNYFESIFVQPDRSNGSGVDTIGFGGFKIFLPGIPNNFNHIAWIIETHVNYATNAGKTFCLDTISFGAFGSNEWLWATSAGGYIPAWDGPHCFKLENEISFEGYLYYLDPVPPTTDQKPMRFTTVEKWDADLGGENFHDLLDSCVTNSSGFFSLGPALQDDVSGRQDIFFVFMQKTRRLM